jgi:biopolymer transport protein ExbB
MFADFDWIGAMRNSPVMLVILACSIVTFGFALERLLYFARRRGDVARLMAPVLDQVRRGQIREATWAFTSCKHPVGPVAAQVIESRSLPAEAQEEKLQIALSQQRLLFERHLGWLGTMGNTAPLIGLLGTVWGIMRAFHDMARTGSAGPSVVAAGVAEALFTTAAGLVVAVPSVMLYNHFLRRTHVMLTEAENHARDLRLSLDGAQDEARTTERGSRAA